MTIMADISAEDSPSSMRRESSSCGAGAGLSPALSRIAPDLGLAAHLARRAGLLGIAQTQEAAWFDYCQALIRFLEPDARDVTTGRPALDRVLADEAARESAGAQAAARSEKAHRLMQAALALPRNPAMGFGNCKEITR